MKRKVLIGVGIVAVGILTYFGLFLRQNTGNQFYKNIEKFSITQTAPLKGKYVLLHFWAKWCEPCLEEIPLLVQFTRDLDAQSELPLKVLAVSLDPTLDEAKQILPDQGAHLPANFILALDKDRHLADAIGSYQYPETYLISPEGNILDKWIGPQKWNKSEVLEYFKKRVASGH